MNHLIQSCETTQVLSSLLNDIFVSLEEVSNMFSKIREKKATLPSVPHMGHYKIINISAMITEVISLRMTIPIQGQFSPIQWQSSVHIILEKIPEYPHVTKLRSIQNLMH